MTLVCEDYCSHTGGAKLPSCTPEVQLVEFSAGRTVTILLKVSQCLCQKLNLSKCLTTFNEQWKCCQLMVPFLFALNICRCSTPLVISATFPCRTRCPLVLFGREIDIFPKDLPQPFCCPWDQSLRWGCWNLQCEVISCGSSCSYYCKRELIPVDLSKNISHLTVASDYLPAQWYIR